MCGGWTPVLAPYCSIVYLYLLGPHSSCESCLGAQEHQITTVPSPPPLSHPRRYKEAVPDTWRVHNRDDLIPMVPRLLGYCHVDRSVSLDASGRLEIDGLQDVVRASG